MKNCFFSILVSGAVLFVAACSEPPPLPILPSHEKRAIERVILDDEITAKDIQDMFHALNQDGALRGVAPWFAKPATKEEQEKQAEQLATIGRFLTRYIYETAHDRDGLMGLLTARIRDKSFSRSAEQNRLWCSGEQAGAFSELASAAMASPHWVDVIERDIGFLSPELDTSLQELYEDLERASVDVREVAQACQDEPPLDSQRIVQELAELMATPGLKGRWNSLAASLTDSSPVLGLLHAARAVNGKRQGHAFDGLSQGLNRLLTEPRDAKAGALPTQFDSLMDLILALNGPSEGIFKALHDGLSTNTEYIHNLGTLVQPVTTLPILPFMPVYVQSIQSFLFAQIGKGGEFDGSMWQALTKDPSEPQAQGAFLEFYSSALTAHETLYGTHRDVGASDFLTFNLPLYLNNYTLAKWMRTVAQANRAVLEAVPADQLVNKLSTLKLHAPEFTFTVANGQNFERSALKEMEAFELQAFTSMLEKMSPVGLGGMNYVIPAADGTVWELIRGAMTAIDQTRPYADGSALMRVALQRLVDKGPDGQSPSILENMESKNLLLSAHRQMAAMPAASFKNFSKMLSGGGGLSEDHRNLILSFYQTSEPALQEKVTRILDALPVLQNLSANAKGPSAFETYLELLQELGPREWKVLSESMVFVAESKLLTLKMGATGPVPRYPEFFRWFTQPKPSGLLRMASQVEPARHRPVADFLQSVFEHRQGKTGSELHWDFVTEVLQKSPRGFAALIDSLLFSQDSTGTVRKLLTPEERQWIVRFVGDGTFRELWPIVQSAIAQATHSTGRGAWLVQLKRMAADGTLKKTFAMLSLVQSDRMKAISAVLQEWESSGELVAFLEILENFLALNQST